MWSVNNFRRFLNYLAAKFDLSAILCENTQNSSSLWKNLNHGNFMKKKITTGVRILLGLIFAVAGLDEFLHFLPPPPFSPDGEALIEVLRETGYFMLLVKGVEAIAGILLLAIFIVAAEIFLSIAYKEHFKSVLT